MWQTGPQESHSQLKVPQESQFQHSQVGFELGLAFQWQIGPHESQSQLKVPRKDRFQLMGVSRELELALVWQPMPHETGIQLRQAIGGVPFAVLTHLRICLEAIRTKGDAPIVWRAASLGNYPRSAGDMLR